MDNRFWLGREDGEAIGHEGERTEVRAVLRLCGELDLEGAPALAEAAGPLLAVGSRTLVLDCHGVTFCDSSGLNTLLNLRQRAAESGARLQLARPSASVRHLLRLTHTERVFHVVEDRVEDTVEDAVGPAAALDPVGDASAPRP
ncbi:Putative anti-sigma factor antagonist [Streptomyces sp. YIM 121038]|uniref:STAS domain-containing protein n=1 Tax=Streptomyces sp. YIM 121038 TaxID=2136401 RepID=UPI00111036B4|nr:STAS domain-containing protein [Streptomyces sp. YIM 121038]QCX80677.1 Putative anti-sigma factor antagonist [Streptomyces sp. YIM 121038]